MADETKRGARAKKSEAGGSSAGETNKSAFILGFAADTPAAEIVKAGAEKGLTFSAGYVSTIRSLDRKRKAKASGTSVPSPAKVRATRTRAPSTEGAAPSRSLDDASLIQLILQYGVVRVEQALARVKAFR